MSEWEDRLLAMTQDEGDTWDLSPNDRIALNEVLRQLTDLRTQLATAVKERDEAREAVRVLEVDLALAINATATGTKLDQLATAVEALEWARDVLHQRQIGWAQDLSERLSRALAAIRGKGGE